MTLLQTRQDLGRAKNALQDYLIKKLLVPKVYLDADWDGVSVDVLAVDRAGSGDVHAVQLFPLDQGIGIRAAFVLFANPSLRSADGLISPVEGLRSLPCHYRYVGVVGDGPVEHKLNVADYGLSQWLAEDGVGRIGILYVDLSDDEPSVQVVLKAERFRSSKEILELADRFVAENTPNWQIPEDDRI
jgi:hypothetical protein